MAAKSILEAKSVNGGQQYVVNDATTARLTGKRNIRLSESSIISIIPIFPNETNYQLNVVDNQGPNQGNAGLLPMEKRLPLQDVLFTSSFGFFLCALNAGVVGSVPVYPQLHFQLFTNPDPGLGGIAGMNDLAAALGLWATGHMEFKVGGETAVPDWWLYRHAMVNQTQDIYAFISPNPYWTQQNYADDGYLATDPMWILNGGNLNQFIIKYGSDYAQVWANNPDLSTPKGYQLAIACIWNGWQAQNASSIMNNAPAQ